MAETAPSVSSAAEQPALKHHATATTAIRNLAAVSDLIPAVGSAILMTQVAGELRVSQTCEDGKRFAELFYEKLDKNRAVMNGLFMAEAKLIWNGNPVEGKDRIIDFYSSLPASETILNCVDAQSVLDLPALQGQPTINVICAGRIKLGSKSKFFTESFTLTALNNTWKIVSDTFRDYV